MTHAVPSPVAVIEQSLSDADFQTIAKILRAETGIFLAESKKQLVYSRLSKRLRALKLSSFSDYCELLQSDDSVDELGFLIKALTTNITSFYREPHHFRMLREKVLPELKSRAMRGDSIRIWSAGCSGGQEPYTVAMEVLEWLPDAASLDVKILATDLDPNMVEKGSRGIYAEEDVKGIEPSLRQKYFRPRDDGKSWQASDALRNLVTFKELNLFRPWPMRRKYDVIFCRNVVIYFEIEDQVQLWQKFLSNMMPEGWLFIGHSERLSGPAAEKFLTCGITAHRLSGPVGQATG